MGILIDSIAKQKVQPNAGQQFTPAPAAPTPPPVQQTATVQTRPQNNNVLTSGLKRGVDIATAPVRVMTGGLGKIGEGLMTGLNAFGGFLKGSRDYSTAHAGEGVGQIPNAIKAGLSNVKSGVQQKYDPGKYLTEDVLNVQNPAAKAALGLATNLIVDPINLVGGLPFKAISKGAKILDLGTRLSPITSKVSQFAKESPIISKAVETFGNPYFRNPEAGKVIEASKTAIQSRLGQLGRQVGEAAKGLSSEKQVRIGELLEGAIPASTENPRLVEIANQFKLLGEKIGQEMVDTGLLAPEQYAKYKGVYMHHMWNSVLEGKSFLEKLSGVPSISGKTQMFRKGAEGYIKEFAAPTYAGLGSSIKDLEAAKMFKELGRKFGVSGPVNPEEIMKLADKGYNYVTDIAKSKGGEILNKTLMPKEVIDYIKRTTSVNKTDLLDKAMNYWRAGKTIYNPAYHVRNLISNQILTDLQTGKGLIPTVTDYVKSVRTYFGHGDQQFLKEAVDSGLIKRKGFGETIKDLANEVSKNSRIKKLADAPKDFQGFAEDTSKLNVFTEFRKQGMSVADAMNKAEEAIFSPYRLNPEERKLASKFIPFFSFARQAAPFVAKTLIKNPERFTKYPKIENAVQSLSKNQNPPNEKYLPEYMKGMVRLPEKNKEGQFKYLNPQYMYPWGSFVDENSGMPNVSLGLGLNPSYQEAAAQLTGKDPYFQTDFIKPGMTDKQKLQARVEHAARTLLPTLYTTITGKLKPALEGRKDYAGRERSLGDVAADVLGFRKYPYDVAGGVDKYRTNIENISRNATARINEIKKDKTTTAEEKVAAIKEILLQKQKDLQEAIGK